MNRLFALAPVLFTSIACEAHAGPRAHAVSLTASLNEVQGYGAVGVAMAQVSLGFATPPPAPASAPPTPIRVVVPRLPATLVRRTLLQAYRAAGLGIGDATVSSALTRSRVAALLPEVRLRGAQYAGLDSILYDASSGRSTATNRDQYRDTRTLEARVTWRLDRLVYGGDEPQLERIRTDRVELRLRLGSKVIEALILRQRALVVLGRQGADEAELDEAALKLAEAEATLDALTAGAFTRADGGGGSRGE